MISEIFVGRNDYISKATEVIQDLLASKVSGTPRFIVLVGPGGIGKSKLATKIRDVAGTTGLSTTQLVDLQATTNRSELSLLSTIAQSLNKSAFGPYFEALQKYNSSEELERKLQYEKAVDAFVSCMRNLEQEKPVVVILDTFESIKETNLETWLLNILARLGGRCGIALPSRVDVVLTGVHCMKLFLEPFSEEEAEELARLLYKNRDLDYDLDQWTLRSIHRLARGRPILITLAIEWILENARPQDIINSSLESFEREMVANIRWLREDESLAILLMASAERRLNTDIMSLLSGFSIDRSRQICANLSRFSFIKWRSEDDVLTLHDEMLRLINQHVDFPITFKNEKRRILVESYYDLHIEQARDLQEKQSLIVEKIYYETYYAPEKAIEIFDREIHDAIDSYDFAFLSSNA